MINKLTGNAQSAVKEVRRKRCKDIVNIEKNVNSTSLKMKYLENGKFESTDCSERHPKICRFWSKNKTGCRRESDCDFLHVTLAQHDGKASVESKVEDTEFKCVSCKDWWTNKNCVMEHNLNNHVVFLCDNWIGDKRKVFDQNWTLLDERGNLKRDL